MSTEMIIILLFSVVAAVAIAVRQGVLSQVIYEKLLADIDARLLRLESGEEEKTTDELSSGKSGQRH